MRQVAALLVALAGDIGARSTSAPRGLARAERYVTDALSSAGYTVTRETFRADGAARLAPLSHATGASPRCSD